MHRLLPVVLTAVLAVGSALAQTVHPEADFNNSSRVVSTTVDPNTGRNQPFGPTTPPSYATAPGVPAGTRAWTWTPKERFQGGHDPFFTGNYLTVMGFTQAIFVGPAVPAASFPTTTETYQFATGIAPVEPQPQFTQAFRHTSTGAAQDIVNIPMASLSIAQPANIFEHSFQLTTPIAVPNVELLLFLEYRGGEYMNDPMGGQTVAADWKGGWGLIRARYSGFATPANPNRTVSYARDTTYRAKIGLLVDEPVFAATGLHGNRYHQPVIAGESYLGIPLTYSCDYARGTFVAGAGGLPSLWFNFEGGSRYATGFGWFTVFFNQGPWFPVGIPFGYGNLLMNPTDPLLNGFIIAGQQFPLGPMGEYTIGSTVPYQIPLFGPSAVGQWLKFQGICANLDPAGIRDIALTNSTSMLLDF